MKKLTLAALMVAPLTILAQSPGYTLKAKIANVNAPAKAYLTYKLNGKNILDSSVVSNGIFQFSGILNVPVKATLILDHKGGGISILGNSADALDLYLANELITVTSVDSVKFASVKGSKINKDYTDYKAFLSVPEKVILNLNEAHRSASDEEKKNPDFQTNIRARYQKASAEKKALQRRFIQSNPDSYFSLIALTDIAGSSMNVSEIEPIFNKLSADLRLNPVGKAFAAQIETARATSIGMVAPQFTQNDVNGKPVSLSSFKGKYVLIDFWASWCGPCRAENPNVVNAFNRYKDKNFTILGISLDNPGKKDAWLTAIEKDQLNWTQLSDLNGWGNVVARLYGVRSIPQNLLLDPDGKIIGKNLRGEGLHHKLKEILGADTGK